MKKLALLLGAFALIGCGDSETKRIIKEVENEQRFQGSALLANAGFTNPHFLPRDAPLFYCKLHDDPEYGREDRAYWKKRYARYYSAASFLSREGVDALKLWSLEDRIWDALSGSDAETALRRLAKASR